MKACVFLAALAACMTSASSFAFTTSTRPSPLSSTTQQSRLNPLSYNTTPVRARAGVGGISMKRKGKPNQNIAQRGGMNQMQQKEMQYREQKKVLESGMPAFQIFVRTKMNNMWYPCGMMMGDDKAKATVDAMMGGLLSGISKYSLEKGVASSVIAKRRDLVRQASEAYPQLKNKELTFGYKIVYKSMEEKLGKQDVTEISKDMTLGPLDAMKKKMGWG